MLLGVPVSPGWVDKAAPGWPRSWGKPGSTRRCSRRWPAEEVLAADETPVNVLDKNAPQPAAREDGGGADPEEKEKARGRARRTC